MTAKVLLSHELKYAADALLKGELVAIPTETVYGLAAAAWSSQAVAKIFEAKERPLFDPLIVHVPRSWGSLKTLREQGIVCKTPISDKAERVTSQLMEAFWPGPLTIILPRGHKIPDLVTSGLSSVGVRVPDHDLTQNLLEIIQIPLAAPSANRFGRISPTTAAHVVSELGDRIAWIVDGGSCAVGVESTVVSVKDDRIELLRPGKVTKVDLERVIESENMTVEEAVGVMDGHAAQLAPGQLASHYAPKKRLYLIDLSLFGPNTLLRLPDSSISSISLMSFSRGARDRLAMAANGYSVLATKVLSERDDASEVAQNMFSALRALDENASEAIVCEMPTKINGLWHAISDRLKRASTPTQLIP